MNALGDVSPHTGPTQLAAGHAPPTPPHEDPLDDIYGSAPGSPSLSGVDPLNLDHPRERTHEILSDLPSRQRALDTDAYREGLSNSKGQYVQEGFDEGYSLGANLGIRVGYILGVLQGFVAAWRGSNDNLFKDTKKVYDTAQKELAIQELLSQQWVTEEGIWNWEVHGVEDDPTFREVAEQHPVVRKWTATVESMAAQWGVDLQAAEKVHGSNEEEQS
ncbi:protein YAE1 [Parastagonospora nodorum]|nr:protein YAE1 [Parastagonospora nodorum]